MKYTRITYIRNSQRPPPQGNWNEREIGNTTEDSKGGLYITQMAHCFPGCPDIFRGCSLSLSFFYTTASGQVRS